MSSPHSLLAAALDAGAVAGMSICAYTTRTGHRCPVEFHQCTGVWLVVVAPHMIYRNSSTSAKRISLFISIFDFPVAFVEQRSYN